MKKVTVILLMLILGYIQVGYYVHSLQQREDAKQEFKRAMVASVPDSLLNTFVLSDIQKSIEWEEVGKEFWFDGNLYDVVKQSVIDGKTYLYCLSDTKEKSVVEKEIKITTNNATNTGKNQKTLKFSIPDFTMIANESFGRLPLIDVTRFSTLNPSILSEVRDIDSPPPQVS